MDASGSEFCVVANGIVEGRLIHSPRHGGDRRLEKRAAIGALEAAMKAVDGQIQPPVRHHFAPGLYARELFLPAGCVAVGKIHRHRSLFIMVSGDLEVVTDTGRERLVGYNVLHTEPGMKRAVIAHADTIVLNFHPTDETDLERIEELVIAPSYEALEAEASAPQITDGDA